MPAAQAAGTPPDTPQLASPGDLSPAECAFLRCLLAGAPYETALREAGRPLSMVVDAINDRLFDRFGDTVLIYDEAERPVIPEDYRDELQGMLA